jgi:OPA family glycerol-3-phosphate transporter-like MFS transporter
MSLGVTLMRETFNTWTPTYLAEGVGLSRASAAGASAFFPLFGGISVLAAGLLSDRLGRGGRAAIIVTGLSLCGIVLVFLGLADLAGRSWQAVAMVSLISFLLIGPYSFMAGAISLDLGGKRGGATASGIIDGVGYLGGIFAGEGMARASVEFGWRGVFLILAGVAFLSSLAAVFYLLEQVRPAAAVGRGTPTGPAPVHEGLSP